MLPFSTIRSVMCSTSSSLLFNTNGLLSSLSMSFCSVTSLIPCLMCRPTLWAMLFRDIKMWVISVTTRISTYILQKHLQHWYRNKVASQGQCSRATKSLVEQMSSNLRPKGKRHLQAIEVYMQKYYTTRVKPAVDAAIAARSLGNKGNLCIIKDVTKKIFKNETDEIKDEIEGEVHALESVAWKGSDWCLPDVTRLTPVQIQAWVFPKCKHVVHWSIICAIKGNQQCTSNGRWNGRWIPHWSELHHGLHLDMYWGRTNTYWRRSNKSHKVCIHLWHLSFRF